MPIDDQVTHYARLVPGFGRCSRCYTWTRTLTEGDARRLVELLAGTPGSLLQVLQDMAWIFEGQTLALQGTCGCKATVPEKGFHLYRLWRGERLLYVGVSTRLAARLRVHYRNWGDLIDRVTYVEYPNKRAMLDAELQAIIHEHPAFNQAGIR